MVLKGFYGSKNAHKSKMNQQWGSQEAVLDKTYTIWSQKSASWKIDPASSQPVFIQMNLKKFPLLVFTLKFTRVNQQNAQETPISWKCSIVVKNTDDNLNTYDFEYWYTCASTECSQHLHLDLNLLLHPSLWNKSISCLVSILIRVQPSLSVRPPRMRRKAPVSWSQWAPHSPSICSSQLPLDGAAQNG